MTTETTVQLTYRQLFAIRQFPQLAIGSLLARTANGLFQVALILYVLEAFHSPALAGLAVFLSVFPGLVISPIAGALLDRHGRVRMILLDYAVASFSMLLLAVLGAFNVLFAPALLIIVTISSLTNPLSVSGNRSLFPLIVPRELWDRANAVDSGSQALALVIGPALAGVLIARASGPGAFVVTALLLASAALLLIGFDDPLTSAGATPSEPLLRTAWQALVFVLKHPTLRGIVLTLWCTNLGAGAMLVGLPLLVFQRFHWGADAVGNLWALSGVATVGAGLTFGRIHTAGRERPIIAGSLIVATIGMLVTTFSDSPMMLLAGMLILGVSFGPMDLGLFALRQRRTDPAWFGRVIAVSMSLNYAGAPAGSAIAGPFLAQSLLLTLVLAAAVNGLAALVTYLAIPRDG